MARQKHTFNPTQSISLTISITGEQAVQVDSHGGRERGSNVVVITDHVAVYVYDLAALATYYNGWRDPEVTANRHLPVQLVWLIRVMISRWCGQRISAASSSVSATKPGE